MEILLATNNQHKKEEFKQIFAPYTVVTPKDLGIDFYHEETGSTYFENAYGKAGTLFKITNRPVLADDSGLSVAALDGAPGIYSSRYGGSGECDKLPQHERNIYLLSQLEGVTDRKAFFVCSLVYISEEYRFFAVQETVNGFITENPAGEGGFGYDPVFYLPEFNKTVAQLSPEEKHTVSHRGKAGKQMTVLLETEKKERRKA